MMQYIKTKEKTRIISALKAFRGHLQVDGNVSYEELGDLEGITLMHCLVHARRYFEKALEYDKTKANQMLGMIQQLYQIERSLINQPEEEILQARHKLANLIGILELRHLTLIIFMAEDRRQVTISIQRKRNYILRQQVQHLIIILAPQLNKRN